MVDIFSNIFLFLIGIIILVISSDWLIQGCVKLSLLRKLTPLFVGLVLVAFGTSAPEAGVGIMAAVKGQKAIALGNIIGSNIANIGLVLGVCALFKPFSVNKSLLKKEMPIMLLSAVLLYILSFDLYISRLDGAICILFLVIFCFISYNGAKKSADSKEIEGFEFKKQFKRINSSFLIGVVVLLALSGIIFGAYLMVCSGVYMAKVFGVSPWVIGITVFAVGTSLPELVASLTAVFKKVPAISLGNVIGSNIFNILFVLGIVALIRPITIEASILKYEIPVMLLFCLGLFVIMWRGYKITRLEGAILLFGYIGFIFFLLKGIN